MPCACVKKPEVGLGVFLYQPLLWCLKLGLLLSGKLAFSARLAGQRVPRVRLSLPAMLKLKVCTVILRFCFCASVNNFFIQEKQVKIIFI